MKIQEERLMKAAILGYGTVGSGVYEVLQRNAEVIAEKSGENIEVKYVLDLREFPGDPVMEVLVHDYECIVNDPEVRIVVETMGGVKPAYEFVRRALECGKHVCTSNKELVAEYGAELLALAKERAVNFYFEASVGGGIPIIRPLCECLTADKILEISGILNGTTNYILTRMYNEGADFNCVLKGAQECGYAERNPAADIEGFDAGRKLAILASLVLGKRVEFGDVVTEGITGITARDIRYARAMQAKIKLIASAIWKEESFYALVAPRIIMAGHPLYAIDDVVNAVMVKGNMLGDVLFSGRGAGKLPTASAVVSDVVQAARHVNENTGLIWSQTRTVPEPVRGMPGRFFVRTDEKNRQQAKQLFPGLTQVDAGLADEFAFYTEQMTEGEFSERVEELDKIRNQFRIEF